MGTGGSRFGAGRPGWRVKAERCLRLDVRDLARRDMLGRSGYFGWRWTNSATGEDRGAIGINVFSDGLQLNFSVGGRPVEQHVTLDSTPCHYGGTRPWLRCPRCHRRVGVLFLRGGNFVCRHCGGLAYRSQSDDVFGTSWRKQRQLEARLGPNWTRPKGMHHRTHQRLVLAILRCAEIRDSAMATFLAAMNSQLLKLHEKFRNDAR